MQNAELMRRELKSRQEANIRGLLSLMEVHQALRGAQPVGPLQPNLVSVPRPPVRAPHLASVYTNCEQSCRWRSRS